VPPIESEDATRIDIIAILVCLSMTHPPFRSLNRSLVPPLKLGLRRKRHPPRLLASNEVAAH